MQAVQSRRIDLGGGWNLTQAAPSQLVIITPAGVPLPPVAASALMVLRRGDAGEGQLLLRWTERLLAYYCPPIN